MRASKGKEFHHVYKIGTREKPSLLKGVFSGVSTAFDPIGGRTVLIRSDEDFSKLKNAELAINEIAKSGSKTEKKLAMYFMNRSENNLSIGRVITFNENELDED